MHDATLEILDKSLVTALELFVLACCVYVAGSFLANYWTNQKVLRGLQSRFEGQHPNERPDRETRNTWQSYLQRWEGLRSASFGLIWSAVVSCLAFLFLCFSPWPTMNNFANLTRQQPPLRVTFLFAEPTDDGFHFEGDVWNQSDRLLPVQASIRLLDEAGANVGGATGPVTPEALSPRDKGQFFISLNAPPAQATSFALHFIDAFGQELTYAKGFPNDPGAVEKKPVYPLRRLPRLKK